MEIIRIFLVLALAASAGLLSPRLGRAQDVASVLPQGIFRSRFVNVFVNSVGKSFDSYGNLEKLASPLSMSFSPQSLDPIIAMSANAKAGSTLAKFGPLAKQLKDLVAALNQYNPKAAGSAETGFKGLGDVLLQTDAVVDASINNHVVIVTLERGLTSRLSTGIFVPIVFQDVRAGIRTTNWSNASAVLKQTENTALQAKTQEGLSKIPDLKSVYTAMTFTDQGYQAPHNFSMKSLGDVETGLKYQIVKSKHELLAGVLGFRLPTTSHRRDYTNIFDQGVSGVMDGQFDIGLQLIHEFTPAPFFSLGTSAMFTWQTADTQRMPVFRKGELGLPDLAPEAGNWDNVSRKLGNIFETEMSASFFLLDRSLNLYGAYQYKYQEAAQYSGGNANLDYARLGSNSEQNIHRFEVGMGYSTIPHVLKNKFAVPFEVRLAYNSAFAGKNRPQTAYTRLDLWAYFR